MSNESKINQIVDEICSLDPSLESERDRLYDLVKKFILLKPNVSVSESFVKNLRQELFSNIAPRPAIIKSNLILNWTLPVLSGAAAVLIIISPFLYPLFNNNIGLSSHISIQEQASLAFGDLELSNRLIAATAQDDSAVESRFESEESSINVMGFGGSDASFKTGSSSAMPVPHITYKYTYIGKTDAFVLDDTSLPVFKKDTDNKAASRLANWISRTDLGLFDESIIASGRVRSFDVDAGDYSIYMNFADITASIHYQGQNERIHFNNSNPSRLSDEEVLSLAAAAIKKFSIDLSSYSDPVIVDYEYNLASRDASAAEPIIYPSAHTVIYPLQINGLLVYDQDGSPHGLSLTIDNHLKKVTSISNITSHNYLSSNYPALTDTDKIISQAEAGGAYSYSPSHPTETINYVLLTPERVLLTHWSYNNNNSQFLLIPALRFPVQDSNRSIIISLIKDAFSNNYPPGDVLPMPESLFPQERISN